MILLYEAKDRGRTHVCRATPTYVEEGEAIFPSAHFLSSTMLDLWAGRRVNKHKVINTSSGKSIERAARWKLPLRSPAKIMWKRKEVVLKQPAPDEAL